MLTKCLIAMLAGAAVAGNARAATTTIEVDFTNTIPNVVANKIIADGEGDD